MSNPPKSPTLEPPRKSVELADPGAHELLDTSENDDDVFADASEGQGSNPASVSPIPTTRVEKIDDQETHGEVPGTAAYKMRVQDAVPDELEIIHDSGDGRPGSSTSQESPQSSVHGKHSAHTGTEKTSKSKDTPDAGDQGSDTSAQISIPKTVVTKVDSEPTHGEIPGTDAFDMRKGDAKPDIIEKQGDVSSLPTSLSRSSLSQSKRRKSTIESASPIAADGGFGPMNGEGSDDESADTTDKIDGFGQPNVNDGSAEDFNNFEAGDEEDDFGDFDEGFQQASASDEDLQEPEPFTTPVHNLLPASSPFPLLDFSELDTLDDMITATSSFLDEIFPSTKADYPPPPPIPSDQKSIFLSDRSLSLWSQLVAPPPLQPPNWVRSRIRRLFLVSLGVPVDLDEILPASKQKKLILPSVHLRSRSHSPPDTRRQDPRVRLKQDNNSTASVDRSSSTKPRKRKGPPAPPQLDLQATRMLCATTTAALSNMTESELHAHVERVEEASAKASEVLEYWLKRRDSSLGDKEAFEGVIENLVKHARKSRK